MKTPDQLHAILTSLIGGWEGECVEFKEGGDNEANLRARSSAWLVFGVKNSTQRIVGTTYRPDTGRLHGLKQQIANGCEPSTTFREIHELLTDDGRVIRFIDENYSRALLVHADMAWPEVLALDTIQKGSLPDEESLLNLRKQGLVEGRKPNLHVTAEIAAATDSEAEYLHHRAFDDRYFCDLIVDYLKTFGSGKRPKFNRLLESKVSDLLTPAQKRGKIDRLLKRLQADGKIRLNGYGKGGMWTLNPLSSDSPETHKKA